MNEELSFELRLRYSYEQALGRVLDELKKEGFAVLTRIDLHKAFKEKLGRDFRPYSILGACNPQLAYRALNRRADIGLLLPCNITIEADPEGGSLVRIANPDVLIGSSFGSDGVLRDVAAEAFARLTRVAESLGAA
ncbi:MAG: DUF302 domain-containing protein [Acidiferrobacterales bacterium]|nr:DUF302 domain-containing protein [Acidiferrobacterales bacterium]